jgi:hypothetical protein
MLMPRACDAVAGGVPLHDDRRSGDSLFTGDACIAEPRPGTSSRELSFQGTTVGFTARPDLGKEAAMIAQLKSKTAFPLTVDVYLGFEVIQKNDTTFVAIPRGWTQVQVTVLQAADLPSMRKRIWAWWHNLLD